MAEVLAQTWRPSQGDIEDAEIDFSPWLGAATITAQTVTEKTTSDLTISLEAASTSELTILGRTVAVGQALTFRYTGQQAGVTYTLEIEVTASDGRKKNVCQPIETLAAC